MEKEFDLSETVSKESWEVFGDESLLTAKNVKEFIKHDTDLINQFACGNITLLKLKQLREELAGKDLIK